jgi:hypothetical protein
MAPLSVFRLAVNQRTAKAIGSTFPQSILQRADQVIEWFRPTTMHMDDVVEAILQRLCIRQQHGEGVITA